MTRLPFLMLLILAAPAILRAAESPAETVAKMPGLIAFWDFKRTENGAWMSAHDPQAADRSYPVYLKRIGDDRSWRIDQWPHTDPDSALVLETDGPFGSSVRFHRGHIFGEVPRRFFDRTPLDISGRTPFTLVAWVKFTGQRHFVAGIWDEGGWDPYGGRRQYALFGGLFGSKGVIAHLSATGAASFPQSTARGSQYARMKAIDGRNFPNDRWVSMAMTYDPADRTVSAFLNGVRTPFPYGDSVIQDVYGHKKKEPVNPAAFDLPIFSPRAFTLKFNGYRLAEGGVAEHRIEVDTIERRVRYGRSAPDPEQVKGDFKIRLNALREGRSLSARPMEFEAAPDRDTALPFELKTGDTLEATLLQKQENDWSPVGRTVSWPLREGAPFTFGRALGLGKEDPGHGSELRLSGVAVFGRVLSAEELQAIRFCEDVE